MSLQSEIRHRQQVEAAIAAARRAEDARLEAAARALRLDRERAARQLARRKAELWRDMFAPTHMVVATELEPWNLGEPDPEPEAAVQPAIRPAQVPIDYLATLRGLLDSTPADRAVAS